MLPAVSRAMLDKSTEVVRVLCSRLDRTSTAQGVVGEHWGLDSGAVTVEGIHAETVQLLNLLHNMHCDEKLAVRLAHWLKHSVR